VIALALKWIARATIALAVFSAATALYMYYTLNFGDCASGGEACATNLATLYAAGIGIVGFGVSGYAAHVIARGFDQPED
jgi:hypothetical protein